VKRLTSSTARILAAAALLVVLMQPPASPAAGGAARPQVWVVTDGTARILSVNAPRASARVLAAPPSIVLGYGAVSGKTVALSWPSVAGFLQALREGLIPSTVKYVMYDPENWPATPRSERLDPVTAMTTFAAIAHTHGYEVIITPHPSLVTVPGATCVQRGGESVEDAFLRCDIAGEAAVDADIVETQAQYLEADPARYASFVSATAAQARAANPKVLVLSGLSTNFVSSPVQLYAAWAAVAGTVDGHYLAIPGGRGYSMAVRFLRLLPH
jgi:hypothetical protein